MKLTYRFRLRDTCDAELNRQACAVNMVWNFCEQSQRHAIKWNKKWPTGIDLQKLASGTSKELGLHSHTITMVCHQYEASRRRSKKRSLRWRVSNPKSPRKSLGWIPFNKGHVKYREGGFVFLGRYYKAWVSRPLTEGQKFCSGSFSQDAQGHWYINLVTDVENASSNGKSVLGIDLGISDLATLSTGEKVENPRWYRAIQSRIAAAQKAKKNRQVRKLHAKARSQRSDFLHKLSTQLVRNHGAIFVGNLSAEPLAKTRLAKSALDAGWSKFKTMLEYKAIRHQVLFGEVNESFSSVTCSACGSRSGPTGLEGLRIRQWVCYCGASHDRDVNAAINIARRGLSTLEEGASHVNNMEEQPIQNAQSSSLRITEASCS